LTTVDFGLPGVGIEPGDHICAVYVGQEERQDIIAPYLRAGLAAGDKCICVVDVAEHDDVRRGVGTGVDVGECLASEQLQILSEMETYLRDGAFSLERMIEFWNDAMGVAIDERGFPFARAVGDTSWVTLDRFEDFAAYESELNRFAPTYPQAILCLYDLERFGGGVLVELLRTHPKLLLGGMLIDNPHYLSPDEYAASRP
jgi:hypothetical protein